MENMITPKSPEQIMEEYESLPINWCCGCNIGITCATEEWLRSSMASLLCYMAERMQIQPGDDYGYSTGIEKAESILIEEARRILEK